MRQMKSTEKRKIRNREITNEKVKARSLSNFLFSEMPDPVDQSRRDGLLVVEMKYRDVLSPGATAFRFTLPAFNNLRFYDLRSSLRDFDSLTLFVYQMII